MSPKKTIPFLFFVLLLAACIPVGKLEVGLVTPTGPETADSQTATAAEEDGPAEMPDLVLVYTLEGGIAAFCDRMEVYSSGRLEASSCTASREASGQLEGRQLAQLRSWAADYASFEYTREDDAVADQMTAAIRFTGAGAQTASSEVQEAIFAFARDVSAQLFSAAVTVSPSATEATPPPADGGEPEEILILSPGPGSRLVSPVTVSGVADSTFEQTLVVRLVTADGDELALVPTIIQAELGQGGPFEAQVSFEVAGETQGFIQVYSASARDGGITHLSSVGVTLAESGLVDLRPAGTHRERIHIQSPLLAEAISGGMVRVEGVALPSFEGTLIIEVLDEDGDVIGSLPIIVDAPDIGQFGTFQADVPYTLAAAGPGRIVVRDPSPAFPGDVHLASVEVQLAP